jgi:hypothetical protein
MDKNDEHQFTISYLNFNHMLSEWCITQGSNNSKLYKLIWSPLLTIYTDEIMTRVDLDQI